MGLQVLQKVLQVLQKVLQVLQETLQKKKAPKISATKNSSSVKKARPKPAGGGRGDLLAAIRKGNKLKKVDPKTIKKKESSIGGPAGGLSDDLMRGLNAYRAAVAISSDDSDDDDEW